jgi:hypothetical protein
MLLEDTYYKIFYYSLNTNTKTKIHKLYSFYGDSTKTNLNVKLQLKKRRRRRFSDREIAHNGSGDRSYSYKLKDTSNEKFNRSCTLKNENNSIQVHG